MSSEGGSASLQGVLQKKAQLEQELREVSILSASPIFLCHAQRAFTRLAPQDAAEWPGKRKRVPRGSAS